ncbi:MAG: dTDP-4-dehydrorhamnose reductase [Clostridiales bacterium]
MRILVTGAKGQLGRELVHVLNTAASDIGSIGMAYLNAEITETDIDEADIGNADVVNTLLQVEQPEIIFNCAAMTNVDGCETDYQGAMRGNAMGPGNLAVAAEKIGAKLVHISTDYVFPGDGTVPYSEWDTCNPKTVYGKSKLLGEQYVLQRCSQSFIVRTAWLYGAWGNNFVKTMLKLGKEQSEIKVVDDQRGNPTNANDLVHHMLKIALTKNYGIYHCSGEGECSWYDFSVKIMELAGLSCKVNPCTSAEFLRPAPRPKFSSLDNLMLKTTVGNEMRPWQDALKNYLEKVTEN